MDSLPENSLSDDISGWPLSPYGILGLERNVARTDVRRAYSALIKRFRPETHPQHFQRILEAFESVLAAVEARGQETLSAAANLERSSESERTEVSGNSKFHLSTVGSTSGIAMTTFAMTTFGTQSTLSHPVSTRSD